MRRASESAAVRSRRARRRPHAGPRPAVALLALLSAACGDAGSSGSPSPTERPPNLVLFTVDTLRADALGAYGGTSALGTPELDALAAESLLFERAYTQATHTHPALSSLMTGLSPPRSGVHLQWNGLAPGVVPVQTLLQARGYRTGSFVANLCRLQEQEHTVFSDGWDETFCGMDMERDQYLWDEAVVAAAQDWIGGLAADNRPWFAWVHLMDPHAEHRPPPDLWDYAARDPGGRTEQYKELGRWTLEGTDPPAEFVRELRELYAAEVAGVDRLTGRFLAFLDARPDAGRTALVFTSDHGEELFESWTKDGHGWSLTEGVLRVPLLVRAPGLAPGRVEQAVETLRVTPTLLQLADTPSPYGFDGPSLLAEHSDGEPVISYAGGIVTARRGDHRLWHLSPVLPPVHEQARETIDLYRERAPWLRERLLLAQYPDGDPYQPRWLYPTDPGRAGEAHKRAQGLNQILRRRGTAETVQRIHDADLDAQLKALGY